MYQKLLAVTTITAGVILTGSHFSKATAQAAIFEVNEPGVEKGEVEVEILSGVAPNDIEDDDARSVHEFAIGYGLTDFSKWTFAVEVENPEDDDEDLEVDGFEIEHVLALPFLSTEGGETEFELAFYTALEIPREDGLSAGAIEFGPIFETNIGPVEWVANVLVEVPFEEGDAGLAYASKIALPIHDNVAIGFENYGEFEEAFGDAGDQEHFAGPAIYFEAELFEGFEVEPRAAVLFGLSEEAPDAVLSFNLEFAFGHGD